MIAFPFVGDTVGGSHRSAMAVIAHCAAQGRPAEAVLSVAGPLAHLFATEGIPQSRLAGSFPPPPVAGPVGRIGRAVLSVPAQLLWLQRRAPSLVVFNDSRSVQFWALALRLHPVPFVIHQRTRYHASRVLHGMLRQARGIVCISDYVAGSLPDDVRGKVIVIPNRIAVPDGSAVAPGDRPGQPDAARLVFVGQCSDQKRPAVFIDVLAEISRHRPVRGVMIGRCDPAVRQALLDHGAARGVADALDIRGYVEAPWETIREADVLVAPAVNEGHGRALVEAMLLGVPVVAADSGGHAEVITHAANGLLAPPDDAEALAAAVERVLADKALADGLVAQARERAEQAFGAPTLDRTLAFYDALV